MSYPYSCLHRKVGDQTQWNVYVGFVWEKEANPVTLLGIDVIPRSSCIIFHHGKATLELK
jgi:hypothetical protein